MSPLVVVSGALLTVNGALAGHEACCCDCCSRASGQSITVLAEEVEYVLTFGPFAGLVGTYFNIPIIDVDTGTPIYGAWQVILICESGIWNASILGPCFAPTYCASESTTTLPKDNITCLPMSGTISWSGDNCDNWPPNYIPAPFPSIQIL